MPKDLTKYSDKQFRFLIENSSDAITMTDTQGLVQYVSPSVKRILGFSPKEMLGKTGFEFIYPEDRKGLLRRFKNIETLPGHPFNFECRAIHKKGGFRWLEIITTNLLSDPHVRAIVTNFRDITERKVIEERLSSSEARYKTILDQSPFSTQIFSKTGKTIYVNNAWEKLWGIRFEKLGSYNILKDKRLKDQGIDKYIKRGFAGRPTEIPAFRYPLETDIPDQDKQSYKWIQAYITPVFDENKKVIEVVLKQDDITEIRQAEKKLEENQQLLQAVMEGTSAAMTIKDQDGRYILVNRQFERIVSKKRAEIIGRKDSEVLPQVAFEQVRKNDLEVFRTGESIQVEESIPWSEGLRTYLTIKFPLYDANDKMYSVCSISTDITERKEHERRKDDFISIASHELKTPITTVVGFLQILRAEFAKGKSEHAEIYLAKMDDQLHRLTELINNLLDVSRMQSGKMSFKTERFDFDKFVVEIADDMQHFTHTHKIITDLGSGKKVNFDKYRMSQVVINLISNAIKYSPKADEIIVKTRDGDKHVTFSVEDFGIGINKKDVSKIFERFYQVSTTIRQSFSGLGLGLYISSEIIKKLGGRLQVESVKGKGSIFSFRLPISKSRQEIKELTARGSSVFYQEAKR